MVDGDNVDVDIDVDDDADDVDDAVDDDFDVETKERSIEVLQYLVPYSCYSHIIAA